jgi:hypothetical protein
MESGIALYRDIRTPPVFWPHVLNIRARTLALAGRADDALEVLTNARVIAGEAGWDAALFNNHEADLLSARGDRARAIELLRSGREQARSSRGRMIELGSVARLAALTADPADVADLRALYDTFTEGFDTPVLVAARAVLAQASAPD